MNDTNIKDSETRFDNEVIQTYNKYLKEVASLENLVFIEAFNVLDIDTDLADGLHPNTQGYEKLYQALRGFLK